MKGGGFQLSLNASYQFLALQRTMWEGDVRIMTMIQVEKSYKKRKSTGRGISHELAALATQRKFYLFMLLV